MLCKDIKEKFLNNTNFLKFTDKHIELDSFTLGICDTVNRHNIYYRYASKYMEENNLTNEGQIPENVVKNLKEKSGTDAKKQGQDWFVDNLEAINELLPKDAKLSKSFKLDDEVTILYKGDESTPKIVFMSYDHRSRHPEYKDTKRALKEACNLDNSIIKRAFDYETEYFISRQDNRREGLLFEDFFKRQSFKYLFEETISFIIKHREQNNLIEFYFGGAEPNPTVVFRGKKAQNDPLIKKYLEGPLKGADQRKFVSVKMVEEE